MKKVLFFITLILISFQLFAQKTKDIKLNSTNEKIVFNTQTVDFYISKNALIDVLKKCKLSKKYFNDAFHFGEKKLIPYLYKDLPFIIDELEKTDTFQMDNYMIYGYSGKYKLNFFISYLIPELIEKNAVSIYNRDQEVFAKSVLKKTVIFEGKKNFEYYIDNVNIWQTYFEELPPAQQ